MDEDRIKRIARAMCRAARLDPDQPADKAGSITVPVQVDEQENHQPAWMLFRHQAAHFAAQNREAVQSL